MVTLGAHAAAPERYAAAMEPDRPTHIVSILTPDRRGIIHRLVATLERLEVPHLEISQTVVHGAFTIALTLAVPAERDAEAVREALLDALDRGAAATLLALAEDDGTDASAPSGTSGRVPPQRYLLTAIGHAEAQVVREITRVVLEHEGNFSDFSSRRADDRLQLIAEVELPGRVSLAALQGALARAGDDAGLAIRLQHQRLFAATNEIAFRRSLA